MIRDFVLAFLAVLVFLYMAFLAFVFCVVVLPFFVLDAIAPRLTQQTKQFFDALNYNGSEEMERE